MKTSIYIPTVPNHFKYLENIVTTYLNGSELPDEIIIGPAIADPKDRHMVDSLEYILSKYDIVKIFPHMGYLEAGPNRQRALFLCSGDIVLYQDSDDMTHGERVYWIKTLFEAYPDTMVINHSYVFMGTELPKELSQPKHILTSETLRPMYFPNDRLEDAKRFRCYGEGLAWPVHAGAACVRREVLEQVHWKKMDQQVIAPKIPLEQYSGAYSEDFEFCFQALFELNKSMVVDSPLYYYRR